MTVLIIICAVLGIICGELVASAYYRIPAGIKTFSAPKCKKCGKKLSAADCIPLFSYIFSGGKMRCCGERMSKTRLYFPLVGALIWTVSIAVFYGEYPVYSFLCAIAVTMLFAVAAIDFSHQWIPDRFQIGLLAVSIIACFVKSPQTLTERLIGAGAGGGFFLVTYFISLWVLKREGLGMGDVKLAFVCGAFLGWKGILIGLILASVSASIILIVLRRKNGDGKETEYPFAPFLSVGFSLAIFLTEPILSLYSSIINH